VDREPTLRRPPLGALVAVRFDDLFWDGCVVQPIGEPEFTNAGLWKRSWPSWTFTNAGTGAVSAAYPAGALEHLGDHTDVRQLSVRGLVPAVIDDRSLPPGRRAPLHARREAFAWLVSATEMQ